jgi:ketosteroid isomerase-like protein
MNLPKVIADLVAAQNRFDAPAYTNCFSETAVVFDEGKTHTGKKAIEQWIDESNKKYKSVMKPLSITPEGKTSVLSTEVSGTFPGSPIVIKFHFDIKDGLIQALKVTD